MNLNTNPENATSSISDNKLLKEHIDSLKKTIDDLNLKITYPFEFQESIRKFNAGESRKIFSKNNSSMLIESNNCRVVFHLYDENVGVILRSDLCLYIRINNDDSNASAYEKYITEAFYVFKSSTLCNAESFVMKVDNTPYEEYKIIGFSFCENIYYLDKKLFYEFLTFEKSLFDFPYVLSDIIEQVDIFERFVRSISYEKSPDYLQKIGKILNVPCVKFVNDLRTTETIKKLHKRFGCMVDEYLPHFNSEIIKKPSIITDSSNVKKYIDDVYSVIYSIGYIAVELKISCLIFKHITKEMIDQIYQCVDEDASLTYHTTTHKGELFITYERIYHSKSLDKVCASIETDFIRTVRVFLESLLCTLINKEEE